jgi:osmotically-inducible protein OsmY
MELTRSIRQKIVDRDDLSTYAKNVKIISDDQGSVTLRGPVRSDNERRQLEEIARSVAGAGKVTNQLEVARSNENNEENQGGTHG